MKTLSNQIIFVFLISVSIGLIYLLSPILTPFLLGALFAYLVDPLTKRLERWHIPHLISVILIFFILFASMILFISLLYPLVVHQIEILYATIPSMIEWSRQVGGPWLMQFIDIDTLKESIPVTLTRSTTVLTSFLHSTLTIIQFIVTLVLTPIVTFYLLRDWNKVITGIKNLIPKKYLSTVVALAHDCDEVLSGFIRGQLLVMLCLAIIYSLGLTIAGLKLGLMIGLIGGLLSIIPYLGSTFVIIGSLIAAFVQSGTQDFIPVAIVFLIGQSIEGYILTPYLVGGRIGLHPVAVIFAIMAGGTLFGFFGVLLALPVAAVLLATFRFFRRQAH